MSPTDQQVTSLESRATRAETLIRQLQSMGGIPGPPGPAGPQGIQGVPGPTGATGPTGPTGATGSTGAQGPTGATGAQGPAGTAGEKWWSGVGAPPNGTGIPGDWWIDTASGDYYEKTAVAVWALRGNLKGPTGANGATGATGPPGQGVPAGGTAGQVLSKIDATNYNTQWTPVAGARIWRTTDTTSNKTATTSYAEISSALRITLTPVATRYYTIRLTGQWEHTAANGYLAAQFYDLAAGAAIPGTFFVARTWIASQNTTFLFEQTVLGTVFAAGARTITPYWSTGASTCTLRSDQGVTSFTITETEAGT